MIRNGKYSVLFILLLMPFVIYCDNVDSLVIRLENTYVLDEKIDIYLKISNYYTDSDPSTAYSYANKALNLALNAENTDKLGLIYSYLGKASLNCDSVSLAEDYFIKAGEYLQEGGNNSDHIPVCLLIGNLFVEQDNFAEAMKYYRMGIDLSMETNDNTLLPNLYNNLGIVYININNEQKALELYTKALDEFVKQNDTSNIAGTTANIGSIYSKLGEKSIGESYYRKAYELFRAINSKEGIAHCMLKIGLSNLQDNNYDSAAYYFEESLELQKQLDVTLSGSKSFFLAETLIKLGITYLKLNNHDKGYVLLKQGFDIAKATEQYNLTSIAAFNLSGYYKEKGEYKNALDYMIINRQYSDSSFNEESVRNITRLEMQYKYERAQKEAEFIQKVEIQKHKRRNLMFIMISTALFLVLIIVILLYRIEKIKKRKTIIERENLSKELERSNKELTTHIMYRLQKNEFIISIAEKLKKASLIAKPENRRIISDLIKELEQNSEMVSWDDFELRFQKVYTGFYRNLNRRFPDLSPNELRLCAFFKLNMTTKEIAAITYQSVNSITVARYRLRKKLGLNSDENLVSFLAGL